MNNYIPVSQNIDNESMTNELIWNLVKSNNFKKTIASLSKKDISDDNLKEMLLPLAEHALAEQKFAEQKFAATKNILSFLIKSIIDKPETSTVLRQIGDMYTKESLHEEARGYYGMLPVTLENLKLCFQTFIPDLDINGLLFLRDEVLSKVPEQNHNQIHTIIDDIMMTIAVIPEIYDFHLHLANHNLGCLKKIPPFLTDSIIFDKVSNFQKSQLKKPVVLNVNSKIYMKTNNIWQKTFPNRDCKIADNLASMDSENIMIHCNSLESLIILINSLHTKEPAFFKYECFVILDFNLLQLIVRVYDLSALTNCNFIIKFIDQSMLKSQLTQLFMEKKKTIPNKAIYLSQDDPVFFLENVTPIMNELNINAIHDLTQSIQQAIKIFPDDHYEQVIQRIASGRKLRIFFPTTKFSTYVQFSTRDIAEGFRQLGHETFILTEEDNDGYGCRPDLVLEKIINFQPDIIFAINHFRYECPHTPKTIPFVTWIQDLMPHMIQLKDPSLLTDHDHIFSFNQRMIDISLENKPVFENKEIHLLPISCSRVIYHPVEQTEKKYDVTYVSHLIDPNHTFFSFLKNKTNVEIKSNSFLCFIKQLIEDLDGLSFAQLDKIQLKSAMRKSFANTVCNKIGIPLNHEWLNVLEDFNEHKQNSHFTWHMTLLKKMIPIKVLLENNIKVRVFGNFWKEIPLFRDVAMGSVKNGTDLNKIYNESRINLNISPSTTYHMKAPEVIAGNNFMISRRIEKKYDNLPIDIFFEIDNEIVFFDDESDLVAKVNFFLANPTKRDQIANAAYNKFISTLTIDKTAQRILDTLIRAC